MKRIILFSALALTAVYEASAQQPAAELVQQFVDAYNDRNFGYFEKMLAPDVVVPDEGAYWQIALIHYSINFAATERKSVKGVAK